MRKHNLIKKLLAFLLVTLFTTAAVNAEEIEPVTANAMDRNDVFYEEQARSIEAYNQLLDSFKTNSQARNSEMSTSQAYPDYYGGAYIDKETGGLVVLVVDSAPAGIASLAAVDTADANVRYKSCDVSFNEIVNTVDIVTSKIGVLRAQGIVIDTICDDIMSGGVIVTVRDLDASKESIIKDVTNCQLLTFENSNGTSKEEDLGGGAEIKSLNNNGTSTIGFAAKRGSVKGYVIAGHAGDLENEGFSHGGTSIGIVTETAYYDGTTADAAFVTSNTNFAPANILPDGSYIVDAGSDVLPIGTGVYKYGKTTGLTSGEIKATVASITYDDVTIEDCYTATYSSDSGDSGAPVMVRSGTASDGTIQYKLCGIHSGAGWQVAYRRFFSPYANIVDELGITCITS